MLVPILCDSSLLHQCLVLSWKGRGEQSTGDLNLKDNFLTPILKVQFGPHLEYTFFEECNLLLEVMTRVLCSSIPNNDLEADSPKYHRPHVINRQGLLLQSAVPVNIPEGFIPTAVEERHVFPVKWLCDQQTQALSFPPLPLLFLDAEKVMGGNRWNHSSLQKADAQKNRGQRQSLRQGETGKLCKRIRGDWVFGEPSNITSKALCTTLRGLQYIIACNIYCVVY